MGEGHRVCPSCLIELTGDEQRCPACGEDAQWENQPHQLPVGTVLRGRYLVGRCIGEGGFGITYAGRDTVLEMKVAIKEYYPTGIVNRYHTYSREISDPGPGKSELFKRGKASVLDEARALARLSGDPAIVDVRDTFEENNTAYIVMEFLDGQTLQQVEKANGPMPFDRLYPLLRPVMESLARIHRQNLIHRDISPSNMMLLKNGRVKLLDFGTMRSFEPGSERSMSVLLKPGYAPEEQYRSHGVQGPWTDVYAMCASIYRLLTGVTPENAMDRVFDDRLAPPSQLGARISPVQEQALMRGLAVQAQERIQTMEALQQAFEGGAEDEDDERTVRRPDQVGVRSAAAAPTPTYAPSDRVWGERVTAPVQTPPAGRAPSDPPQTQAPEMEARDRRAEPPAQPEREVAEAATPAKEESRKKPARPERPKASVKGGGKKRPLRFILLGLGAVAVLAVVIVLFSRGGVISNPYRNSGSYANLTNMAVTKRELNIIDRDSNVKALSISGSVVSDDMIQQISRMERIKHLSLENCTGFTTLDPLADMPALKELNLKGSPSESDSPLPIDELLTRDLSGVKTLLLSRCQTGDGGAFLTHFPSVKYLSLYNLKGKVDMKNVEGASALDHLTLRGILVAGHDYSPLSSCVNMKNIDIKETPVTDIKWMAPMTALQLVTIEDNSITSLDGLQDHAELRSLTLPGNLITDISALAGCKQLRDLDLTGNQVHDISPLASCLELTELQIANNGISDLSALAKCVELTWLDVSGNRISDISALRDCVSMRYLYLNNMQLTELNACEFMIDLKYLEARNNRIEDIGGLKNTTQLETIALSGNQVEDIAPLSKNAEKVKTLFLQDNRISDLSAISGASNLHMLSIENNEVKSLEPLSGLTGLNYLSAGNNHIQSIEPLGNHNALSYLDLGNNEIADISPLVNHTVSRQCLLLQNNRISDISMLPSAPEYRCLSLYGNPITDFSRISAFTGVGGWDDYLYLTWSDGLDYEPIATSNYQKVRIIGMPIDQQAPLKARIKEIRSEKNLSTILHDPEFISETAADADMAKIRENVRKNEGLAAAGMGLASILGY